MSYKNYIIENYFSKIIKLLGRMICILQYNEASKNANESFKLKFPKLNKFLEIQIESGGGIYHHNKCYKLSELYQFVYKNKPNLILELGGGATTAVFLEYALDMKKKGIDVKIITIDESNYFLSNTQKSLEKIYDFKDINISFIQSERKQNNNGCYYSDIKKISAGLGLIDLVYVDGPTAPNKIPCIDVTLLENDIKDILFDIRIPSVKFSQSKFIKTHDTHLYHPINKDIWIANKYYHHSMFLKRKY